MESSRVALEQADNAPSRHTRGAGGCPAAACALSETAIRSVLPDLHAISREIIPDDRAARLSSRFFERTQRLSLDLPPSSPVEVPNSFAEILSAAWAYQIIYGEAREGDKSAREEQLCEYRKTCRLVLKAIELMPTTESLSTSTLDDFAPLPSTGPPEAGVLGGPQIAARLRLPLGHPKQLDVVPLDVSAIKSASLDVHLGHRFVVARRTRLGAVTLGDAQDEELLASMGREEIFVPSGGTFLIHPGDLVLGSTLEFIALPADVMAFVEGRSGLGRMGLIVATATQVAPGFHGVIVLQMANAGTLPLRVRPGMPVAQLVLQAMTVPAPLYNGKYHCQVHP